MAQRTATTQQTGTAQSASKKNVLCVFHNDLVDSDNLTSAVVWAKMVQSAQKEHGKDAVKSFFVFEPHRVNLGIRRVKGTDIPFILMPMCNALFKKGGLVEQHKGAIQKYASFTDDLKKVLDRHETNLASTVVRADLTPNLVKAIVKCEPIMKALRAIPYKFVTDTVNDAWIEVQLNKCVPAREPATWKEDSTLAAKLVVQDFVKTLRGLGVVGQQDPFYLDVDVLDKLDAPLCRHMEHPEWLVNNPGLVKEYMKVMAVSELSEDQRHQKVKALVTKELDANCQKSIHHIPGTYEPIVKAGQQAEKIFFFGGSSMSVLDRLVSAGLGPKIDFAGQGGTKTPQLNLTGNTFNWDLNPYAAYRVLTKQADPKVSGKISSFQIGTTELGKSVAFDGNDVTAIAGNSPASHSLGRRIATYGVTANRVNPEKVILAPADYAAHFKEGIFCPDLAALFSAYSPKRFCEHYSQAYPPTQMWIIRKDGTKDGVDRVRFATSSTKQGPEELFPVMKGAINLWLAKDKKTPGPWMVKGTAAMAAECADTLTANVGAVLNAQAGTTGSAASATGQTGGASTANKATPVRKATGGAPSQSVNGQQPKPQPRQSGNATPQARPTGTTAEVSNQAQPRQQPRQSGNATPQVRPTGAAPTASGGSNVPAATRLASRPAATKTTRQTPSSTN